ncbi:MAG: hypothetical protein CM15mP59_1650 [Flavobacteriaceae bacterium]|nr:MAG: hypothetical protein CM15mP59_1650 [Flavobacteriaceae bacterium]
MLYRKRIYWFVKFVSCGFWNCLLFGCQNDEHDKETLLRSNHKEHQKKSCPWCISCTRVLSFFESYRYYLWKDLIDGGWDFDYIGTEMETGSYPNYKGLSFDTDHQGKMRLDI